MKCIKLQSLILLFYGISISNKNFEINLFSDAGLWIFNIGFIIYIRGDADGRRDACQMSTLQSYINSKVKLILLLFAEWIWSN